MISSQHLSDEQFAALLAGDAGTSEHVRECPQCRAELETIASGLRNWTEAARRHATRPEGFWDRQSNSVFSRAQARLRRRLWMPVAAAAILLLSAALVLTGLAPRRPVSPLVAAETSNDALLRQIEEQLSSDVPDALAPATLLTDDLAAHWQPAPQVRKEKRNEM